MKFKVKKEDLLELIYQCVGGSLSGKIELQGEPILEIPKNIELTSGIIQQKPKQIERLHFDSGDFSKGNNVEAKINEIIDHLNES